ncbi:hypothetical protein ACF09I_34505 [Streptomyces sp. NPDC014940]|uniref:hypothetical protein n=1 Tax=Streptomyces sp. NPDC014940 TaxID=3364932 RepID=UPI0036F9F78A
MSRRATLITAAAVTVAGLIAGLTYWLTQPSYDDIVKGCQTALTEQTAHHGKGRPDACKDVHDDDYNALVLHSVMDDLGWTDKDGRFSEDKMLDSVTDQP